MEKIKTGKILIVDDESSILYLFKKALNRSGYTCDVVENGEDALLLMQEKRFDIVITDINMPGIDGIQLSKEILRNYNSDIIIMTGQGHKYQYNEIIRIGASDFVEKPFSIDELELRVNRVLTQRKLKKQAEESHDDLKQAYIDSIHRLVMASEFKDENTGDHIIRIGEYSRLIAELMQLSPSEIETIYYASPMHDVGKIGIPDLIMQKPGKLTHEEFEIIKTHTTIGAKLLSKSKSTILKIAEEIALNHHEKWNGTGYPNKLSGENIPLPGRIVAIADTFDALTSQRPYKDPYPPEMVFDIIRKEKGKHFDPVITDLFLDNFSYFLSIRQKTGSFGDVKLENFMLSDRDKSGIKT